MRSGEEIIIAEEDYTLHRQNTQTCIIFLQRKKNIYDGRVTKPQRLSTDASGREGGSGERFVGEIIFFP